MIAKNEDIKKILIVDDHPVFRQGISRLIMDETDLKVCGEAESTDEALQAIQNTQPDLIIVDLSLKNSSGIDLIKAAKSQFGPQLKMLAISMHEETIMVERAIRSGARGYVTKREAADHLLAAIRNVLEGKFYLSEATKERTLRSEFSAPQENAMSALSDRELEIFQLIGEGLTATTIAKNMHLSVKTVEGYRKNIRTKLKLKDNMDLIRHAIQWAQCIQAA
ncbi:MAG TPA: response regulator transcription factor [Verrucomicrobiae bacterium]|nr:response regulator transcription factor [Verrucomicrobiae bacterium]